MRFSVSQTSLSSALSVVQKGISSRTTLPVLSGVLIETVGDDIVLQSSNMELSIRCSCAVLVEEPGKTVLPGKLVMDIVKNLPDAAVHMGSDDGEAILTCEQSSFSIRCLNPADFPAFPQLEQQSEVSIPFNAFSRMAKKVCRVVSKDESRPILTGALLEADGGRLRMVATDSYRLALSEMAYDAEAPAFSAVIAGSFLTDIASLPDTGEDVQISIADNQVIVTYGESTFVNRRIEGNYPNYRNLLPNTNGTKCLVDRAALLASARRCSLLGKAGSQVRFSINEPTQTIQLTSSAQDIGSTQETVRAQIEGEGVEIAFNSHYVMDGLSVMDSDEISFEVQSSLKPGIFKGTGDEDFLYLVMPVRL